MKIFLNCEIYQFIIGGVNKGYLVMNTFARFIWYILNNTVVVKLNIKDQNSAFYQSTVSLWNRYMLNDLRFTRESSWRIK